MVARGANVDAILLGWPILLRAILCNNYTVARYLIEKGASVEAKDSDEATALTHAVKMNNGFDKLLLSKELKKMPLIKIRGLLFIMRLKKMPMQR